MIPIPGKKIVLYAAIIAVVLVLAGVYFWGRSNSKKRPPIKSEDLPNSGSGIPAGWSPSVMSDELRSTISGINWLCWNANGEAFMNFYKLETDDMFTAVVKDYNGTYDANLYDDIKGEVPCGVGLTEYDAEHWKNKALERMRKLNLRS